MTVSVRLNRRKKFGKFPIKPPHLIATGFEISNCIDAKVNRSLKLFLSQFRRDHKSETHFSSRLFGCNWIASGDAARSLEIAVL